LFVALAAIGFHGDDEVALLGNYVMCMHILPISEFQGER